MASWAPESQQYPQGTPLRFDCTLLVPGRNYSVVSYAIICNRLGRCRCQAHEFLTGLNYADEGLESCGLFFDPSLNQSYQSYHPRFLFDR